MTPDSLTFELVDRLSCISIYRDGKARFLVGNDLYDISDSNLARFLLEVQGWGSAAAKPSTDQFRWLETSGAIQ